MQFKKDLLKVFSTNFITLIISIIMGFIIPAFISLDQYAYLKTFTLYLSYVGILHFGFIDGLYIKYGGKLKDELDIGRLKGEHKFLLLIQLVVTLISLLLGLIFNDMILLAFSISILPVNIQTLFQFLYQAIGEFNIYSKIMLITPNMLLVLNLLIIFVLKINNYWPFILANIITYYLVFVGLEIYFLSKFRRFKTIVDITEIWNHFKIGSFILVGNLSSMFFFASDRWFVKIALSVNDFAFYSFAVSMLGVINILINSVTMIFYPYIARGQDSTKIREIKKYLLIIGVLSSGGYFAFELIINIFLVKYIPSLNIISILFAGYPAIIIINALYINLYKAYKQEKRYVFTVVKVCAISVVLNVLALLFVKGNYGIAIATTVSFYIWYFYSVKDFLIIKHKIKEVIYLGLYLFIYIICVNYLNWLFGAIIYFSLIIVLSLIIYRSELMVLICGTFKRVAR